MKKYNTSGNVTDVLARRWLSDARRRWSRFSRRAAKTSRRENVMKQAASLHDLKLPMLLPGITISTSADDFAPIKQMQLMKFDGNSWKLFGDVISGSGRLTKNGWTESSGER